MELPKYPKWKNTGIEWLHVIPEHWEMNKFRYLFTLGRGLGITKKNLIDEGIPCVNYGEIHSRVGFEVIPEKDDLKCVSDEYLTSTPNALLTFGDFVYADTSEDIEGSGNFTHLNSQVPTFAGYHTVTAKKTTGDLIRFLAYLFDSNIFRYQIRKTVTGVKVFSVTQGILKNCYVWLPPVSEQEKIVEFLDYKITKIDCLIKNKKELIEKLNEQRVAIISQAVNQGINCDAVMKGSEVEWLGENPSHWKLKKLRFLGKCQNGINIGGEYFGSGSPFVSYGDVYKNCELPVVVDGLVESSDSDRKAYSVESGDVLFTRTSETIEEIGMTSVCMTTIENAVFAGFLIRFRPEEGLLVKEFSKYYFQNIKLRSFFVKEMNLVTRASLSQDLLKNMPVLLPPINEQKEIAKYLEKATYRLDQMVCSNKKAIDRFVEYRAAIITAAVTGEIDVRNVDIPEGL